MTNEKAKKLEFMAIILDLKEAYMNFDFELMDENNNFTRRLELWHGVLGHIDLKTLSFVVLDYIKTSIYAPQSPAHILNHYKKIYLDLLPPSDEAFEYCIDTWRKNRHHFDNTIKALEEEEKIVEAKAFSLIKGQLYRGNVTEDTSNIMMWGRKEFKEHYLNYSNLNANEVMKSNNTMFQIENKKPKLFTSNERKLLK